MHDAWKLAIQRSQPPSPMFPHGSSNSAHVRLGSVFVGKERHLHSYERKNQTFTIQSTLLALVMATAFRRSSSQRRRRHFDTPPNGGDDGPARVLPAAVTVPRRLSLQQRRWRSDVPRLDGATMLTLKKARMLLLVFEPIRSYYLQRRRCLTRRYVWCSTKCPSAHKLDRKKKIRGN